MTKASDNVFPKVWLDMQTSDPAAPTDADWKLYSKANGIFARSSNAIVGPFGSGTGSAALDDLTDVTKATSMPGGPATNDLCYRTDLGLLFYYDGTRWVTTHLYEATAWSLANPISANAVAAGQYMWHTDYNLWVVKFYWTPYVATTNTGSAYWNAQLRDDTGASLGTALTTAAASPDTYYKTSVAVGAATTSDVYFDVNLTKTSTPGSLYGGPLQFKVTYRLIGT